MTGLCQGEGVVEWFEGCEQGIGEWFEGKGGSRPGTLGLLDGNRWRRWRRCRGAWMITPRGWLSSRVVVVV